MKPSRTGRASGAAKAGVILKTLTTLGASMSVSHIDNENDSEINPGDTLEYTLLITNTGSSDNTIAATVISFGRSRAADPSTTASMYDCPS